MSIFCRKEIFLVLISVFGLLFQQKLEAAFNPNERVEYRCKAALAAARLRTSPKKETQNSEALAAQLGKILAGKSITVETKGRMEALLADIQNNPDAVIFVDLRNGNEVASFIQKAESIEAGMVREDYRQGPNYLSSLSLLSSAFLGGPLLTRALLAGAGAARFFEAHTQGVDGRKLEASMYLALGLNLLRQGASFASYHNMVAGMGMIGASGIRFLFPKWSGAITDAILLGVATQVLMATNAFHLNAAVSNDSAITLFIAAAVGVAVAGPMEIWNRLRNLRQQTAEAELPNAIPQRISEGPTEGTSYWYDHFDRPADSRIKAMLVASRKLSSRRPDLVKAIREGEIVVSFDQILLEAGEGQKEPQLITVIRWKRVEKSADLTQAPDQNSN